MIAEKLMVEHSGMVNKKNINMNILEIEYISGKWEVFGKHEFGISLPKRGERDTGK
jgi:hypothetical protein